MFFDRLGLVSSEEHIPQVNENTEKAKWLLVALESAVTRPRQAGSQGHPRRPSLSIGNKKAVPANSDGCRPPQLNFFCIKNFGSPRNHPNLGSNRRTRAMSICLVRRGVGPVHWPCVARLPTEGFRSVRNERLPSNGHICLPSRRFRMSKALSSYPAARRTIHHHFQVKLLIQSSLLLS